MDFTSDSTVRRSSVTPVDKENSNSSSLVDENDLRVIRLHEEKESLLSKRNDILDEIDSLSQELKKSPKTDDRSADDIDARLIDLILLAKDPPKAASIVHIDGQTDLKKELATKYDTLPIMNMQLRLKYLQDLYVDVKLEKDRALSDNNESIVSVRATFSRSTPFDIWLTLRYKDETLLQCDLQKISKAIEWNLKPLMGCHNPSRILLGCFEFDKIRHRRSTIFEELIQAMSPYTSLVEVARELECKLILKRLGGIESLLQITFLIDFNEADFLPNTIVTATLAKGENNFIDIDGIKSGLIKEYGLSVGLKELCKACLCL